MSNLLFSFQGRANRAKFWLVTLGMSSSWRSSSPAFWAERRCQAMPEQIVSAMRPVAGVVIFVFRGPTWVGIAVGVKR